jgi:hypothetical protein
MRTRSLLFLALFVTACSSKPGVNFTADDAADVAVDDVAPDESVPDVSAPDASQPDASAPDARPMDVATADVPRDVPVGSDAAADRVAADAAVTDVAAPDVGACMARPLGSRLGSPVAMGTTSGATTLEGSCGGEESADAAFSWTAPRDGTYRIHTGGSAYDTLLYVLDGTCTGAEIECNDDAEKSVQSELFVTLRAGQTVVIVVDGFGGDEGDYELNIEESAADAGPPDA